ncbi:hypothetical protein, partial [Litchfieldella qijiaojingensis]|uniref:hypothetical protein n=1 Tax=Litchfieldella qijiaojingensis TaxID=980347 RepID=UPI001671F7D1
TLDADRLANHGGRLVGDLVTLTLDRLDNDEGLISARQGLHLDLVEALNNRAGRLQVTNGDLVLNGGVSLDNTQGILVAKHLQLTDVGALTNRQGQLIADSINLDAASLDNANDGLIAATAGDLILDVADTLDNTQGRLQANGNVSLTVGTLTNTDGTLASNNATLDITQDLHNQR